MRLNTPESLLYPITVTKLLHQPGDDIEQNAPLFTYEYKSTVTEWDPDSREDVERIKSFYADFESELEGNITSYNVRKGQVLQGRTNVAEIEEACKHEIQFGGICANCGKDMTTVQYNSTAKNTDRATVNTVHGHTQLLVSQAEASRADEEAKRRLLDTKKLSLVVDLDQTIIHATVEPTVGEWQNDPSNPNYDAVKDVRKFQLIDEGPVAKGCWYYIKLRPGLQRFLELVSECYELHIYTMGTRAYAENIVKIIDPDRKFFGQRILSRDESGSMTAKNLKRLFPVDTKMVVIIDDRGDVWQWSPNLIKVSPYDFFVGIGDINSSFLPKRPELEAKPSKPANTDHAATADSPDTSSQDASPKVAATAPAATTTNGDVSAVDRLVSMAGNQDEGSMKEKIDEQDEQITEQLENRPLLQKQKFLDAAEEEARASPAVEAAAELLANNGSETEQEVLPHPKYRQNLLQDDDTELGYLGQNLSNIHQVYFDEYQKAKAGAKGGRVAELRPGHGKKRSVDEFEHIPDAAVLMASMKARVLQGVNLVFSGVVPLGVDIHSHDIAIWAKSFGATVSENISKRTSHVIASPERRTAKVRQAAKRGGRISIVTQGWLFACFTQWRKLPEGPYRIHSDAPINGSARLPDSFEGKDEGQLSSSDEEAALTEDETDPGTKTPNGLSIATDVEDLEKLMPSMDRADSSPTEQEEPDYWADINDELDAFMGSDADDDSDAESVKSDSTAGLKTPPSARKRKRDAESEQGEEVNEEASDSQLQKRKKEALSRASSLTQMVVPSSNGSTPAAAPTDPGGGGGEEDEGDDDLEAMLAAEMERESDDEAGTAA
ncbi:CTD phosphatase Fcp1 [Extremus antarcticus]|uniref:RNA polymerase II subunit A C-terminal domain phosphatase n=1 Tax=Extremus antarcticus TaxID=702011 RepID=A0AAJ0D6T2_9PEZI|nr:CTD phosphatase Fcp1 [Extremus antarcticus]